MGINQTNVSKGLTHFFLLLGVFVMLFPFLWMLLSSFKSNIELLRIPITILPEKIDFSGYNRVRTGNIFVPYMNTIIVSVSIVACQLVTASMAACAFARLDFPGKKIFFFLILCMLMIPPHMTLVTKFKVVSNLGMSNQLIGIIAPSFISITVTFFFRQGFMTFPRDLEDAAIIDGCSRARIFAQILIPLQKAILTAMGIMILLFAWNDLLWPLVVINSEKRRVLSIFIALARGDFFTDYSYYMAASTCAIAPMIIVYSIFQKAFVSAITMSGIKG